VSARINGFIKLLERPPVFQPTPKSCRRDAQKEEKGGRGKERGFSTLHDAVTHPKNKKKNKKGSPSPATR